MDFTLISKDYFKTSNPLGEFLAEEEVLLNLLIDLELHSYLPYPQSYII